MRLRRREIMALEWSDADLEKRQLAVARSEWKGHITATKGGRVWYVPMTHRLREGLKQAEASRVVGSCAASAERESAGEGAGS